MDPERSRIELTKRYPEPTSASNDWELCPERLIQQLDVPQRSLLMVVVGNLYKAGIMKTLRLDTGMACFRYV